MCVQYLHALAGALEPCGPSVLFYLAAAVSDFYMPWPDMVGGWVVGWEGANQCCIVVAGRQASKHAAATWGA
jgi:hypothetical protein